MSGEYTFIFLLELQVITWLILRREMTKSTLIMNLSASCSKFDLWSKCIYSSLCTNASCSAQVKLALCSFLWCLAVRQVTQAKPTAVPSSELYNSFMSWIVFTRIGMFLVDVFVNFIDVPNPVWSVFKTFCIQLGLDNWTMITLQFYSFWFRKTVAGETQKMVPGLSQQLRP